MPVAPGNPAQRLAHEGKHRHLLVATTALAVPAAPTVPELTHEDVIDFSRYMPKNGVSGDPTENYIDSTDITETFDAQQVGSWGEQITWELYKQFPDDDLFQALEYGQIWYWVNLWAADADSPKDGDPAYVRHVELHEPKPLPHAPNEKQRFRVGTASISEPEYKAVVVAGAS